MTSLGRVLATSASTVLLTSTLLAFSGTAAHADTSWSGTLTSGIAAISVGTEDRAGYSRDLFRHWSTPTGTAATPGTRC